MGVETEVGLYIVYLGGEAAPGRLSEDHEVVAVVATDLRSARRQAREKWSGVSRPHVDAVLELAVVDGYRVGLAPTDEPDSQGVDVTYEPAEV